MIEVVKEGGGVSDLGRSQEADIHEVLESSVGWTGVAVCSI